MWLITSILFLVLVTIDIVIGSIGAGEILNDAQEMISLFLATIFFVLHILKKEKHEKDQNKFN